MDGSTWVFTNDCIGRSYLKLETKPTERSEVEVLGANVGPGTVPVTHTSHTGKPQVLQNIGQSTCSEP